jgi:hypothetical protein
VMPNGRGGFTDANYRLVIRVHSSVWSAKHST